MHFQRILRRCGHGEEIGIAGGYGNMDDISEDQARAMAEKYEQQIAESIKDAESKLCIQCFDCLSDEDKRKEIESHE